MNAKVCKALAPVTISDDEADGPGMFEVVLSDATMDRDGESIQPDDFEPLPEWLSADMDHEMSCLSTVGSGDVSREGDRVLCRGTFAATESGQTLRALVRDKHIRNVSVAFLRNSQKMATDRGVARKELLNFAFTPVPANPSASVLASKTTVKAGRRNSADDQEHIQAAHDSLVSAGADCDGAADKGLSGVRTGGKVTIRGLKVIQGSVEALQSRITDALRDAYQTGWAQDWYCISLHGVIADGDTSGTVYFDTYGDDMQSYQQTYTDDGHVVTLNDDLTPVDLLEIVVPDADAAVDPAVVSTATVGDDEAVLNSYLAGFAALDGTPA